MFFENMKAAASSVAVLYIMVAVGFLCDRINIFTEKTAKATVNLLLYVIGPVLLVNSFLNMEYSKDTLKKFFISLALAFATHIIGIILNIPFFRKKDSRKNPVLKFASIYGNTGFMAIPLAQSLMGTEGVFFASCGMIAYNVFAFTHGTHVMSGEGKFKLKKLILNPGVISCLIGMPLFLLQIKLPSVITQPIEYIGSLNTPIAMLIFGTYLSKTNFKTMLFNGKVYIVALLKLIIMPLICLGIYRLIGITGSLLVAAIITAAVPSGNNTFMFASKYDKDYELASQTVALVSFISILTMPTIIAVAQIT